MMLELGWVELDLLVVELLLVEREHRL